MATAWTYTIIPSQTEYIEDINQYLKSKLKELTKKNEPPRDNESFDQYCDRHIQTESKTKIGTPPQRNKQVIAIRRLDYLWFSAKKLAHNLCENQPKLVDGVIKTKSETTRGSTEVEFYNINKKGTPHKTGHESYDSAYVAQKRITYKSTNPIVPQL